MERWAKELLVVTCLAMLVAVGQWLRSEERTAPSQAAGQAEAAAEMLRVRTSWAQRQAACWDVIDTWDAGDRAALQRQWGEYAEYRVERCRWIVSVEVQ